MFNLQEKWIELDSLLEGVQSEMKEKQIVSNYLKSLGMKRTVPVVIQQKLQDRRLARIYVWKNSPIGNVALLTGRSIEPSLHFLVLETENHDGDEIDMAVAVSGTNYVSIPIPHTLERRMAQNSHSVHQQPVHSQRPVHHKPKPVQRKSKPVKSKRKQRKPARHNPANASNGFVAPPTFPQYADSNATPYMSMKESFPSVWLLAVLNKFFPEIVISSKVQLGDFQLTVVLDSPYLSKQNYKLAIEYKYIVKKGWMDLNIHLQDKATSTVIYTWGVELLADDATNPTVEPEYAHAIHSKLMPFIGKEIQTYISNPSGYVHPTDFAKVNLSNVRPRQMKNHTQPRPVVDENNQPIEDFESGDNNAKEQNREIIEQTVETVRSRTSTEPTFDEIDEPQDQSDQVRIKYDFEGLQEEPIIPITDDLLFTLDDFSDVKWTTKIDYKNLWWIFAKNMTLQPICERLNKLFVPKVEDIGKAIVSSEWCVKQVNSTLKAGKQEKVEMIFGLSANYTIQKTKLYGSVINKTKPISEPQTIELAFGITSQSNGLRLRVGKCTNGKSLNGFTPQKAYRLTMPYKQFKGMHLTDVMVGFFNMVLIHILSNPNILAKIGEYCELPTRQTFTGVTKTVIQPTVDRSTVVPRPMIGAFPINENVPLPFPLDELVLGKGAFSGLDYDAKTLKKEKLSTFLKQRYSLSKLNFGGKGNDYITSFRYYNLPIDLQIEIGTHYIVIKPFGEYSDKNAYYKKNEGSHSITFGNLIKDYDDVMTTILPKVISDLSSERVVVEPRPVAEPNILDTVVLGLPNPLLTTEQKDAVRTYLDQKYDLQFKVISMGHPNYINYIETEIYTPKEWVSITIRAEGSMFQKKVRRALAVGTEYGKTKYGASKLVIDEQMLPQAYTLGDLIPILDTLINFAKPKTQTRPTTQSVRDTLSSVMPQIEFINSLDQIVSTEPSLNKWYAGSLAYDYPETGNYFEIVLFAHLMTDNKLRLSIQIDDGTDFKSFQFDDYFAILAKVEQTERGDDVTEKTWEIVEGWYNFLHYAFDNAGLSFISSTNDDGHPQFIIHLGQQTTQRVASPAPALQPQIFDEFFVLPVNVGFVVSPKKDTANKILFNLNDGKNWLYDLWNGMLNNQYFKKGNLELIDGHIFQQTHNGEIRSFGFDPDKATELIEKMAKVAKIKLPAKPATQRVATPSYDLEGLKKWAYDGGYVNGKKNIYQSPFDEPTFVATIQAMDGIMSASHKKELVEMYFKGWQEGSHRSLQAQTAQEPRIQTPKIQLADAMDWAVKRGVFNFENHSTFKAPAQDKELMDLYTMVVNEYGSSAGQDLFDAYTASWNKAHKDFTDAQIAQQQAQQAQATVEPPQGSTGSLGTQISTIDDVLQYPDGTLFVTPNQNNDYEIRVFSKVGDELFGFDEDGSALTLDFDELEDLGDLFYQSIQIDPFRIQQVYFDQSESKQMVADALQAIGM